MAEPGSGGELVLWGHRALFGARTSGHRSSSERTSTTRHLSVRERLQAPAAASPHGPLVQPPASRGSPSLAELESSLWELKREVEELQRDLGSQTPTSVSTSRDAWFLTPSHRLGVPLSASYPGLGILGVTGTISSGESPLAMLSRPVDFEALLAPPHLIGVPSLRPPRSRPPSPCRSPPPAAARPPWRPSSAHPRALPAPPPRRGRPGPWTPYSLAPPSLPSFPRCLELSERLLGDPPSPYQEELCRLRLQRLRVEEDLLLQLQRQRELERLRGPQRHWYALKGPQFHYEARKNNELLRSHGNEDALRSHRLALLAAAQQQADSTAPPGSEEDTLQPGTDTGGWRGGTWEG
ncbi:uncharacterized protein [Lepisosteus oculatus]|uniref:uncharacterized protein n=1 Tax=Lepisosteus oculatus TaxID=7918 RepID=UPI00370F94D5